MHNQKIEVNPEARRKFFRTEKKVNALLRSYDYLMGALHLGGRASNYDDHNYEFVGGAKDNLRTKHYDKSLRFLWKGQVEAPWSSFRDATRDEKELLKLAEGSLDQVEKRLVKKMRAEDFAAFLNEQYTQREKQAMVNVLSLIGHGEAYAWMVSTELLNEVKSTGGRAALTMQVLEEAKHFVVLRELIQAFDCPIPRLSGYEYFLLERILKLDGMEKFFGMNVVVEGFALSLFGMLSEMPGMELLKKFHLDESRHTALPGNYLKEFPLTIWQKHNPVNRMTRLSLILPALPIVFQVEEDLAELGIDSLDFGGSMARKILNLAERVGFYPPLGNESIQKIVNFIFNQHAKGSRPNHTWRNYMEQETTVGKEELQVEAEVFQLAN